MPLKSCKVKGRSGTKWGYKGKCYRGSQGKAKALRQVRAIRASGYTGNVYCPTGEGGGVDPSCPGHSSQKVSKGATKSAVTGNPNFKRWFKGSKVKSKDGTPLVVYHGTSSKEDFTEFKVLPTIGRNDAHLGWHFGTRMQASRIHGDHKRFQDNKRLYPVYLSLKNPARVKDLSWASPTSMARAAKKLGALTPELKQKSDEVIEWIAKMQEAGKDISAKKHQQFTMEAAPLFRSALEKAGYDGIVYRNEVEGSGDSYIAFHPNQIKSAIGNKGAFSSSSPDILNTAAFSYPWEHLPSEDCCHPVVNVKYLTKNPLRIDPSRTATLRRAFTADLLRRFEAMRKELRQLIVAQDAFGLAKSKPFTFNAKQYAYLTLSEKSRVFLRTVMRISERQLLDATKEEMDKWWSKYSQRAYREGASEAFDFIKKKRWGPKEGDFYRGAKQQFLQSALNRPADVETVKLMSERIYSDLKGISDAMSTKLNRTLTDGLVQGKGPEQIAKEIEADIEGIGKNRSRVLARTEMVRAKAEGQLAALESLNVPGVSLKVEWVASGLGTTRKGNLSPCPKCRSLANKVYTLREAKGLIPHHPNCMCGWTPAAIGEQEA